MHASPASRHRTDLEQRGFTSLPAFFDADACALMRRVLDQVHRDVGSPPMADFGFAIHPLFPRAPELAQLVHRPAIAQILNETLGGPTRCVHSGARLSDGTSTSNIGYHHHYAWPTENLPTRTRLERLLFGVYVDGTEPEQGALVVLPRAVRDTFLPPSGNPSGTASIPGQVELSLPPGTVVIFDTALWHTAHKGTGNGRRRLFGTHTQRIDDLRPHPEDNDQPFIW